MNNTIATLWEQTVQRATLHINAVVPPLLVALAVLLITYVAARLVNWLLTRTLRGQTFDRFLSQSGIRNVLGDRGWASAKVLADAIYVLMLLVGALFAISVFDTELSSAIVATVVTLLPKLVLATLMLLFGSWLALFLGRTALIWGVNENMAHPRRWAVAARALVFGLTVVVVADTLNFAAHAFLITYLMLLGGAIVCLALVVARRGTLELRRDPDDQHAEREPAESLWNHL